MTNSHTIQILHLAPHVGGGVGAVLLDWLRVASLSVETRHTLACLDACHPASFKNLCSVGTTYLDNLYHSDRNILWNQINNADIVLLHYWNHPLLARLLAEEGLPASRLICWCHNSGLHEPSIIPSYLTKLADRIIFTSKVSWGVQNLAHAISTNPEKFDSIHSTRDLGPFLKLAENKNFATSGRNLLYIGTVSYDKLHPDTLSIITQLGRDGFSINILGGPDHAMIAKRLPPDLSGIKFLGPIDDVKPYLSEADIFIYPLRINHYGTGEQAILEAMASGLPVIAFNNPAESVLIADYKTGRLVSTPEEFIDATKYIAESLDRRMIMSKESVKITKGTYSAKANQMAFDSVFQSLQNSEKVLRPALIDSKDGDSLLLAFALNSLQSDHLLDKIIDCGSDAGRVDIIVSYINSQIADGFVGWETKTKGSPGHYKSCFADSITIAQIVERLKF